MLSSWTLSLQEAGRTIELQNREQKIRGQSTPSGSVLPLSETQRSSFFDPGNRKAGTQKR